MITVKPAQGKMIRDPVTGQYVDPDKGMSVDPNDIYWRRRLRDGDVTKDDTPPPEPPPDQGQRTQSTAKPAAKSAPVTGASATQDSGEKQ